jgi:hypothetical protein
MLNGTKKYAKYINTFIQNRDEGVQAYRTAKIHEAREMKRAARKSLRKQSRSLKKINPNEIYKDHEY